MTHTICRECETQAHCMEKGCIPITPSNKADSETEKELSRELFSIARIYPRREAMERIAERIRQHTHGTPLPVIDGSLIQEEPKCS